MAKYQIVKKRDNSGWECYVLEKRTWILYIFPFWEHVEADIDIEPLRILRDKLIKHNFDSYRIVIE